jgi:hypothetical protein
MTTERALEARLRKALIPVTPRKGYATVLKQKLLAGSRMPVELERVGRGGEVATLTTLGLGAVATVAAVATIGGMVARLLGSGALILGAAKRGMWRREAHTQAARYGDDRPLTIDTGPQFTEGFFYLDLWTDAVIVCGLKRLYDWSVYYSSHLSSPRYGEPSILDGRREVESEEKILVKKRF